MLAASSSSRIASQARPSRPSRIRSETNMATASRNANTTNLNARSKVPIVAGTPGISWNGPVGIWSIPVMPLLPLVMFQVPFGPTCSPLRKISGRISPKPG